MLSQTQPWKASIPHIILYLGFLQVSAEEKPPWENESDDVSIHMSRSDLVEGKTTPASDDKSLFSELLFLLGQNHRPQNWKFKEEILREYMKQTRSKIKTAENFREEAFKILPKTFPVFPNLTYRNRSRLKWMTRRTEDQSNSSNKIVQESFNNKNNFLPFGMRRLLSTKPKNLKKVVNENTSKSKLDHRVNLTKLETTLDPSNVTTDDDREDIIQIRSGLQRSEDAMWGLACTIFILVLLVWAVWFSGMCKPSSDTFIHAEYSTAIQHMSVREMLKNRARFLPIFKSRRHRGDRYEEIPLVDDAVASDDDDNDEMVYDRRWESIDTHTL